MNLLYQVEIEVC